MSEWHKSITAEMKEFIAEQKVFFVATAPHEGRINLSPKGMDTFRVVDDNRVLYLDLTGSGNETAAHLLENGRITVMFCSFDKTARIMRLYGRGRTIHPRDDRWNEYFAMFPSEPGVRQIMEIEVETAMTSCGYAVPREGVAERDTLRRYWQKCGDDAVVKYQQQNNLESIDGLPTGIFADDTRSAK
ncbi:MAG: pyridoxamine 5'-phosphate oxidase family protein [Candidatus Binatus sp.]|uniref:pyridoxamine 5'-phosphate oxidase family protein n=1 Tax=Candidatus Binatus sp. TaxID=2811406 RepID=UPI002719483B|nr:pyridoxamine 5'-phosphate oxidase family protein [Candidatus Binatus sp.]MDO8432101.1 pyridoxamine 5'-phosphate oxidase family protein [Candidatus Binatus sp.]